MNKHRFNHIWYLKDGYPKSNGLKVFGTFICGGGSTMGYKLAGFEHLGGVEIDKEVADVYNTNHKPKHLFNMDIREFNKITNLPEELFNLDILDGSPPCSTFSMAGSREKNWGKAKQFREGQANQVLDDLVYVYCDTIIKLKPKVFLLENVKGIISGNAKVYSKNIVKKMTDAGYNVQVFCLNAATMGVPQKRERVFFIGHKKEFNLPKLKFNFTEKIIPVNDVLDYNDTVNDLSPLEYTYYQESVRLNKDHIGKYATNKRYRDNDVANTITSGAYFYHPFIPRRIKSHEFILIGTFPQDYNFKKIEPKYLIGMSVPPVMTAQIATEIYNQWFTKLKNM